MTQGLTDLTNAVNALTTAVNNAVAVGPGSGTTDAQLAPITAQVQTLTSALNTAFPAPPPPAPPASAVA